MNGNSGVLIDPNQLSREGFLAIMARGGIEVVAEAAGLEELGPFPEPAPDLLMIDCGADARNARGVLERLRRIHPTASSWSSPPATTPTC
jgi:DNA-binding NarL/FixJ family response regulator